MKKEIGVVAVPKEKMKGIKTVQVGPRNWQETLPLLLVILENGDAKGQAYARKELRRMAAIADMHRESAQGGAKS